MWARCARRMGRPWRRVLFLLMFDLSSIDNYLTSNDSFNLPFQVTFDVLWFSWGLFSAGSVRDFIEFE